MRWQDGVVEHQVINQFDGLGRIRLTQSLNDGIPDPATVKQYTYDTAVIGSPLVTPSFVLGRLASATSSSSQITLSYDAFGAINAEVYSDNQGGVYVERPRLNLKEQLESLEYDLPDNQYHPEVVTYSYDSADVTREVQYKDDSGIHAIYHASAIDAFGRVVGATYGAATNFHAAYASGGRRLPLETAVVSSHGARRTLYDSFDALERELKRREIIDSATASIDTVTAYDALGRVQAARQAQGPVARYIWNFQYDPLGNVTHLDDLSGTAGATLSYQGIDRDQICRVGYGSLGLGQGSHFRCNVFYDALGDVVSEPARPGSETRQFTYFAGGEVRSITAGSTQAEFSYDALGEISTIDIQGDAAVETRHDRRYGDLLEQRTVGVGESALTVMARSIPGPGGILASKRGAAGDWVFEFGEPRGNRSFTTNDGTFIQDVAYQPFGEAESTGAAIDSSEYTRRQWNDGDFLAAVGLSQLGARLYDPVLGRFLSRDPLPVTDSASRSNPYGFAANDPVNATDPTGLECEGCGSESSDPGDPGEYGGGSPSQPTGNSRPATSHPPSAPITPSHEAEEESDDEHETEFSRMFESGSEFVDRTDLVLGALEQAAPEGTAVADVLELGERGFAEVALATTYAKMVVNPSGVNIAHSGVTTGEVALGILDVPAALGLAGLDIIGLGPNSMIDRADRSARNAERAKIEAYKALVETNRELKQFAVIDGKIFQLVERNDLLIAKLQVLSFAREGQILALDALNAQSAAVESDIARMKRQK
jgi:RHS repeat-associated protein